ncbi:MAG: hypothetical protein RLN88_09185 [Ekhidna sp.]|uniref:hypothetical protein n=1 Tax=Ekhidna sp. TaxID=2608089 RepID=UPI0032EAC28A
MKTRSISYIESEEDQLEFEVNEALKHPIGDNLSEYFKSIAAQCAMMGIDINNVPNSRKIYYIADEHE